MQVEFELNADDYVAAHQLYQRGCKASVRWLRRGRFLVIPLLVIAAHNAIDHATGSPPFMIDLESGRAAWVCALALGVGAVFLEPLLHRWNFRRLKRLFVPVSYTFGEQGVDTASAQGTGHTRWSAFRRWQAGSKVILLHLQSDLFHTIPTRCLTGEQLEALPELLTRKIGPVEEWAVTQGVG